MAPIAEDDFVLPGHLGELTHLTYREWHAFVNGFYRGFTAYKGTDPDSESQEKHYWRAGFIFGWVTKVAILLYAVERLTY